MPTKIEFFSVNEVARLTGITPSIIETLYTEGILPTAIRSRGKLLVADCDLHLLIETVATPGLDDCPARKKQAVIRKLIAIKRFNILVFQHKQPGEPATCAYEAARQVIGVPLRTLFRWRGRYRKQGIVGLIDTRGGNTVGNRAS